MAPLKTIEVSQKGQWVQVPALEVNGTCVLVRGSWLKMANIYDEAWLEEELENPADFLQQLKISGHGGADFFTFAQKVPGSAAKHDFPMELDSVAAISTSNFKQWWEGLPQETRKNVRRSQKRGVEIKLREFGAELVKDIQDVNNDSRVRQGGPNVYYGRSLEQLTKDYRSFSERSDFICAYCGEEMIGFLKVVYRGKVASILNLTPKASHADKRPANAMIAKAVELCEAKGVSYLTYGLYNYGNKQDSPLREFKVRNGFQEYKTPRYYVPLTHWGQFCFKLKLHRGILGVLPHSAITTLVGWRAKWQQSRLVSAKPV